MARRMVFRFLAGGVAAVLSACGLRGGNSYRFKITVEAETSEGLKTGSSVYEVTGIGTYDLVSGGKGSSTKLRGEALAVDLPNGKTLFALLRLANATSDDDNLAVMSMRAMDPAFTNAEKDQSARRIASTENIKSPVVVEQENYPLLATFINVDDPTTIIKVDSVDVAES